METFGKARPRARQTSATVTRVGRLALLLGAFSLLLLGAAPSTLLAGAPAPGVSTTASTSSITTVTSPSVVAVSGHGWGHGLGLAQWGAYGYAKHGWSAAQILGHYYTGTTLERRATPLVRVLLLDGVAGVTLASAVPWTVSDARGRRAKLKAGALELASDLAVPKSRKKLRPPLSFEAGAEPITVDGKPYRGRVVLTAAAGGLLVVNALKLEPYVKGVVGYEMPHDWPAAALQAQAVAARTYALAALTRDVTVQAYDVYADTRDQV